MQVYILLYKHIRTTLERRLLSERMLLCIDYCNSLSVVKFSKMTTIDHESQNMNARECNLSKNLNMNKKTSANSLNS